MSKNPSRFREGFFLSQHGAAELVGGVCSTLQMPSKFLEAKCWALQLPYEISEGKCRTLQRASEILEPTDKAKIQQVK